MSFISLGILASKGSTILSWGLKLFKGGMLGPVSAAMSGLTVTGRFLAFTTLGRATVLVVLLLGTFTYFKSHFTAVERHKWEVTVAKKQEIIEKKVTSINTATRHAQELARAQNGWWDRIVAVVVDGIWKVQPQHPIEPETIDLINETRGGSKK